MQSAVLQRPADCRKVKTHILLYKNDHVCDPTFRGQLCPLDENMLHHMGIEPAASGLNCGYSSSVLYRGWQGTRTMVCLSLAIMES